MLSTIVGSVDSNSAFVLVAFFAMVTIIGGILFGKHRTRTELNNDYMLAKYKEENTLKVQLANIDYQKQVKEKEIASHHQLESEKINQGAYLELAPNGNGKK